MAGTININQIIPDPGQDLYLNTGQYGANLVVGNATTQLFVVSPLGVISSGNASALGVPTGTTANRPLNPQIGFIRFNTDTQLLENYTANGWIKVSVNVPSISSISGTIYSGNTSTLTINGTNFGAGQQGIITYTSGANTSTIVAVPTSETLITTTVPSTVYGWSAGSSVSVTFTNYGNGVSSAYNMTIVGLPTGGNTISTISNTRIHTFTSSGTLTVPTGFSATASYLVIAGGGGGGSTSDQSGRGGGGAGGLLTGTTSISVGSYSVIVGAGGGSASSGAPSTSFGLSAVGGGTQASPGGSGGGGGEGGAGGSGTPGQGNPGANGAPIYKGGGGGGAGSIGGSATPSQAGSGGSGLSSSISGSVVYYAGGGGATSYPPSGGAGAGGSGGGGAGGGNNPGTINTGGGGGAYNFGTAGSGGSGVVIISYSI